MKLYLLGTIGSGVDFERRIAEIYQTCREPDAIRASFEQLRLDLAVEITKEMAKTRQMLLENFDQEVQDKLRVRAADSLEVRSRFENLLMDVTRAELAGAAEFDDHGFLPHDVPAGTVAQGVEPIALGRYELPKRKGDGAGADEGAAHTYRIGHTLAQWALAQAKSRSLSTSQCASCSTMPRMARWSAPSCRIEARPGG